MTDNGTPLLDARPHVLATRTAPGQYALSFAGIEAADLFMIAAMLTRLGNRMVDAAEAQAAQAAQQAAAVRVGLNREQRRRQ